MHSDWRLVIDGDRATLTRSLLTLSKPYLPLLAFTVLWYPLLGLLTQLWMPSTTQMTVLFCVPIIGMVLWCPRLASERRRIVLERSPVRVSLDKLEVTRAQVLEVVLLPKRDLFRTRYRILVAYTIGEFVNIVQVASEPYVEAARGTGAELAAWLDVPLKATASPPPKATLRVKT